MRIRDLNWNISLQLKWWSVSDGELSSKVEDTIDEVKTILSHERGPWNCKQVSIANGLSSCEHIVAFVLANKFFCWPRPCSKLIVNSKAHWALLLHSQKQPKAMERALLIHVAMCWQEKTLTTQMECLRINPAGWE